MLQAWQGNIRELENYVERLVTCAEENTKIIDETILPPELKNDFKRMAAETSDYTINTSLQESMEEHEKRLICQALKDNNWNQRKTAKVLKLSERNLRYKLVKYGINKPR